MEERTERKRTRKPNKKRLVLPVYVAAAAAAALFSALFALKMRDSLQVGMPVYTYIDGLKLDWPGDVRLTRDDDTTFIESGGRKVNRQDFPLTTQDGRIILQKNCSLNKTDGSFYRVDYFTCVGKDAEGVFLARDGKTYRNLSGFLYDNDDTYIFLERAAIPLADGRVVEIAPLTVVQVDFMYSIQIFGPGVGTVFEMQEAPELSAEFPGGQKVDLATDCYYEDTGAWRLLFLPLEKLPAVGEETAHEEK